MNLKKSYVEKYGYEKVITNRNSPLCYAETDMLKLRDGTSAKIDEKGKEANFAGSLIMNEYMPDVQTRIARDRWVNAANMGCRTIVTENPAEYEMLKKTAPEGYEVKTVEQVVTESLI